MWGNFLNKTDPSNQVNVIDLFDLTVTGGWYALKRDGIRLNELLRKKCKRRAKALFSKTKGRKYYNLKRKTADKITQARNVPYFWQCAISTEFRSSNHIRTKKI
jgi:hypothetical protein